MIKISDLTLGPTSLQQKTALFIILPMFLILITIGLIGLRLVRNVLLEQWQETAIAKLQQTAHHVDMKLMQPKELLKLLQNDPKPDVHFQLILEQLQVLDGVVKVKSSGFQPLTNSIINLEHKAAHIHGRSPNQMESIEITAPQYDTTLKGETVSLVSTFTDESGRKSGSIEVVISFNNLIDQIVNASWWKSNKAFLVDRDGNILASTTLFGTTNPTDARKQKFGKSDPLEKKTLDALQAHETGTVFGNGMPPDYISGYCRLTEAPWTMVVVAPGDMALRPIISFRNSYILLASIGILLALFYLRAVISRTTTAIRRVSRAASDLANGAPSPPLAVTSRDEVGELTLNFNSMAEQLQERIQLQEAMHIAKEIQQNLLPSGGIIIDGIDSAGVCIYCDDTGGDYYDLFITPGNDPKMMIVVGDVVGHGIGAALLMATVRALLRSRVCQPGTSAQMINDVNKLLCLDTARAGNFVTLFFLTLNLKTRIFNWVRCGHEPALVYTPGSDTFSELRGEGLVLGVDSGWEYNENTFTPATENQIILLGSDGVWEAENSTGERFGKHRVRELLANHHACDPKTILEKIISEISLFLNGQPRLDDITLVILKTESPLHHEVAILEKLDK